MTIDELRQKVNRKLAEYQSAKRSVRTEVKALAELQERGDNLKEALALVQRVAMSVQQRAHKQIAELVTRCLRSVFGEDAYEFRIIFESKRGRTEARLAFVRDGLECDPMDASGGGVVDVAAFALRLSCLLLSRPPVRRVLIMDEPLKNLSVKYRPRVKVLLEELSSELGIQLVVVTHMEEILCGNVVEL